MIYQFLLFTTITTTFVCAFRHNGYLKISTIITTKRRHHDQQQFHKLHMALTPIGPFCHYSSAAFKASLEPTAQEFKNQVLQSQAPDDNIPSFATEMAQVQLEMQQGNDPDPDQLFRVADGIDAAVEKWDALLERLYPSETNKNMNTDFQTVEYSKLIQAHLENTSGLTPTAVSSMMKWQAQCMKAMALHAPPPLPPRDLDLNKLASNSDKSKSPSLTAIVQAETIVEAPFDESAFDNDADNSIVRDEFQQLCQDHQDLIEFGQLYSTFDSRGKLLYLDQLEMIEERWDIFYQRLEFMMDDVLNPDYVSQCQAFLKSMTLTEDGFRRLLKKAHDLMRNDVLRAEGDGNVNDDDDSNFTF